MSEYKYYKDPDNGNVVIYQQRNPIQEPEAVEITPEVLREIEARTWVSLDERMPDDYHEVMTNLGYVFYRDGSKWRDASRHMVNDQFEITHWRELPAYPKE